MSSTPERPVGKNSDERPPISDADGVDLTLIRWMLTLSPSERLDVLVDQVRTLEQLRIRATAE